MMRFFLFLSESRKAELTEDSFFISPAICLKKLSLSVFFSRRVGYIGNITL